MKVEAEESALLWIAKEATGSLRDSYTLLDQVASFSGGRITLALIHEKLGVVGLEQLNGLAAAFLAGDGKAALEMLAKILEQGVAVEQLVVDLAEYFRSLLFLQQGIGRESLLGYSPESFLKQAVAQLTPAQVERAIELLLELHRNLRFSLNPRFELELVVARLARLTGFIGPEDILAQIRRLRDEMAGGAAPGAPAPAAAPPARRSAPAAKAAAAAEEPDDAAGDEDPADSGDAAGAGEPADARGQAARRVIETLRRKKPALASAMDKAEDVAVEEGRLRFTFKAAERYSVGMLNAERQAVEAAASEVLGRAVRLEVVTTDAGTSAETRVDEKVEMVKRVFKGQVVDGG
jgi:DNA polymerase-3 subunit gamma/tau